MIESPTLPQQALLYRLCGRKDLLHADPDFAAMGGFDRPIIHGLCSYGITLKGHRRPGARRRRHQGRALPGSFRRRGLPGETYVTSYWKDGDKILLQAKVKERDAMVISNAAITLRK